MDHATLDILRDLAVVMVVAGVTTFVFHLLRQPVILGYLIAGVIIGPFTPPYPLVSDVHFIEAIAELGIILLMFGLGLEFSLKKLRSVGRVALVGGALQVLIVFATGYEIGLLLGWSATTALFLGAALSISSTALIVKVFEQQHRMTDAAAQVVIGILVFEDFAAIAMIAVLSGVGTGGEADLNVAGGVLATLGIFIIASLVLGLLLVPRVTNAMLNTGHRELALVFALGFCFGMALLSRSLGLSVAAGAFIAGALVSEGGRGETFAEMIGSIRDMFAALFFVAIGMLLDPSFLLDYWPHILVLTAVLIVAKTFAGAFATFVSGYHHQIAIRAGLSLAQIGEFSLVLAKVGDDTGAIEPFLYPVIVGVTAMSTLTTPYLIGGAPKVAERVDHALPPQLRRLLMATEGALKRLWALMARRGQSEGRLRRSLTGILLNYLVLGLIAVGGRVAFEQWVSIADALGLSASLSPFIVSVPVFILAAVPIVAFVHYVNVLSDIAPRALFGARSPGLVVTERVLRVIIRNSITSALLLGTVSLFVLAMPRVPEVSYLPLAVLGFAIAVTLYLAWNAFQTFHQRIEDILRDRLLGEGHAAGQAEGEEADG